MALSIFIGFLGIFFISSLLLVIFIILSQMMVKLKEIKEGVEKVAIGVQKLTIANYLLICEQYHLSLLERVNLGRQLRLSEEIISLASKGQEPLKLPSPEEFKENDQEAH